jgi:hypothetical protein
VHYFATHFFHHREQYKTYKKTKEIQGPYAQYASYIKVADMDGARKFSFFQQQVSDEEAAEHKKEINAQRTIFKQKLLCIEETRGALFGITKKRQVAVMQEHGKKTYEPQSVEIRKKDAGLFGWRGLLHQCA